MVFRARAWDKWVSGFASRHFRNGVAEAVALRTKPPPKHDLLLYDFEASPWCRLVREYATILDLTLSIRPCPRETLLFGEGSFSPKSIYRMEAQEWHRNKIKCTNNNDNNNLTFPLLVDRTQQNNNDDDDDGLVVLNESYEILEHLWRHYGQSVLPNKQNPRPDQVANCPSRSFARRFLSLAGPSYLRPWPRCGLMLFSRKHHSIPSTTQLILYQAENCPESRLVREALCCLLIPYVSVPVAKGSSNIALPNRSIPVLSVRHVEQSMEQCFVGAEDCLNYLDSVCYCDSEDTTTTTTYKAPTWFDPIPHPNVGRSGGANFSVLTAAVAAIRKGNRAFVPDQAMQ